MKPITQTVFGPKHGNCYAACIASIFEIPLETLPQVPQDEMVATMKYLPENPQWSIGNCYDAWWWEMWDKWFDEAGLLRYRMDYNKFAPRYYKQPAGYSILTGASPRNPGKMSHACVAFDGKLVHDPHPDRTGLWSMEEFEIIVPKDPARLFKEKQ